MQIRQADGEEESDLMKDAGWERNDELS